MLNIALGSLGYIYIIMYCVELFYLLMLYIKDICVQLIMFTPCIIRASSSFIASSVTSVAGCFPLPVPGVAAGA